MTTEQTVLELIAEGRMLQAQAVFNENIELFDGVEYDALFTLLDNAFTNEAE